MIEVIDDVDGAGRIRCGVCLKFRAAAMTDVGKNEFCHLVGYDAHEFARLRTEIEAAKAGSPDDLRARGWTVAVHNDYRNHGNPYTFWLLTKGDRCVKGEGLTDTEALNEIRDILLKNP